MSEVSTLTRPAEGMKLAISSAKDAHYVPGRRQRIPFRYGLSICPRLLTGY